MEYFILVVITIASPYVIRHIMCRFDLEILAYIMLFVFSYSLLTMGYPILGMISLLHVTAMTILHFLGLD